MTSSAFEIAVYEMKDPDSFATNQERLHTAVKSFDGYRRSLALRSLTEPAVFADVVLWSSLELATAAAEALPTRSDLSWFTEALGEIRVFEHFEVKTDPSSMLDELGSAALVEIVVGRPANPAAYQQAHELLHGDRLVGRDGVAGHLRLPTNHNDLAADLIGWRDEAAFNATGAAMMAEPDLAALFDEANENVLFMNFQRMQT